MWKAPISARRLGKSSLVAVVAWATSGFFAPGAQAVCSQVPGSNDDWECVGSQTTPFDDMATLEDQKLTVRTDALVRVVGDGLTGIAVGDDTTVDVERRSRVKVEGDDAIALSGGHQIRLTNRGSIRANGDRSTALSLDARDATSGISDPLNTGRISAVGTQAVAIETRGRVELDNRGQVDASGAGGVAVLMRGENNEIANRGLIEASDGATAVRFAEGATGSLLVNHAGGVVRARNGSTDAVDGSSGDERIRNLGTIRGNLRLRGGDDKLVLKTGSAIDGFVEAGTGNDALVVRGGGRLPLRLQLFSGFETLELDSGGRVDLAGSGAFTGGVSLERGMVTALGPVAIDGAVDQRRRNVLGIGLEGGLLDVTGQVDVRGDLQLIPEGYTAAGSRLLIEADGGLVGDFRSTDSDLALLDLDFIRDATSLSVDVTRRSYASVAETGNQREAAELLDALVPFAEADELDPELDDLLGLLDVQDLDGVLQGYDAMSPEYYDAHTSAAFDMGREFDAVLRRPPLVCQVGTERENEAFRRPCGTRDLEPWFLGWGSYLDRNAVGGNIGYEQKGGGLAIGVQKRLRPWLEVGAGVGAARRQIDVDHNGRGSVTTADVGVNAAGAVGPLVLRAAASFGYGWHDTRRDVDWPLASRAADADYDHTRVGVSFEAAPHLDLGPVRFEPYAGLDYTWLDEEDVDESGAGALDLDVDGRTNSLLAVDTGLRVRGYFFHRDPFGELYDFSDTLFVPELRAGYRRVLTGEDRDLSAELDGAPSSVGDFDVDAKDAEEQLVGGVGLTVQPQGGATVGLFYDVGFGDRNWAHVGSLQVRIPLQAAASAPQAPAVSAR